LFAEHTNNIGKRWYVIRRQVASQLFHHWKAI